MDASLPFLLDDRDVDDFYAQSLRLAQQLCSRWGWLSELSGDALSAGWQPQQGSDPGLVVYRVAALLSAYVAGQLNQVPRKYSLAFYDFMGMVPRPPTPARAAVKFELAAGIGPTKVPSGTTLSAQSDRELVFSTEGDLMALPLSITRALVIDVPNGQYNTLDAKQLAGDTAGLPPKLTRGARRLDHVLYLAGPAYWTLGTPCDLDVTFVGTQLTAEAFNAEWFVSGQTAPVVPRSIAAKGSSWKATFAALPQPAPSPYANYGVAPDLALVRGDPQPWLSLVPPASLFAAGNPAFAYPFVTRMTLRRSVQDILPDYVFTNGTKVEFSQGFYPFGKQPKINDCLYIGSAALFSQNNLEVTLHLTVDVTTTPASSSATPGASPPRAAAPTAAPAATSIQVSAQSTGDLAVERWDPTQKVWISLGQIDGSSLISGAQDIKLVLSQAAIASVAESTVNGQACRWLRLRLLTGVFGDPDAIKITPQAFSATDPALAAAARALSKTSADLAQALGAQGIASGYVVERPGATVPYFRALRISQTDTLDWDGTAAGPLQVNTFNNFQLQTASAPGFQPFLPLSLQQSTVALGMAVDGPVQRLAGQLMSFYVATSASAEPSTTALGSASATASDALDALGLASSGDVSVSASDGWRLLGATLDATHALQVVRDDTRGLSQAGLLQLRLPSEPRDLSTELPFGAVSGDKPLLWIASPPVQGALQPAGVYVNAIEVEHSQTIRNEVLGSATGEASQVFSFERKPLLENPVVVVREPSHPGAIEGADLEVISAEGSAAEFWVRWREVQSFTFAGPRDRCYTIDYLRGALTFGDNIRGMTPPKGTNNVVAQSYRSGGGASGNVALGDIARLRLSIGGIKSVTNPEAAAGGTDSEGSSAAFMRRSARALKTQQRAVCAQDFAGLALDAAPEVAFATTVSAPATQVLGDLSVVIVSYEGSNKRMPSPALLQRVRDYLLSHMSMTQHAQLRVVGPVFRGIAVKVTALLSSAAHGQGAAAIQAAIARYLNPITGGDDGTGWGFQASLYADKLRAVIAALPEVRAVSSVTFEDRRLLLRLSGRALPWPPAHEQLTLTLTTDAGA